MRAHLIDTDNPLKEGSDVQALCGELVKNVIFVYSFDSQIAPELVSGLNTLNTCKNCYRIELTKRYIYGLLNRDAVAHLLHEVE